MKEYKNHLHYTPKDKKKTEIWRYSAFFILTFIFFSTLYSTKLLLANPLNSPILSTSLSSPKPMHKLALVNCRTMPWGVHKVLLDLISSQLKKHQGNVRIHLFTLISEYPQLQVQIPGTEQLATISITSPLPNRLSKLFLYTKSHKIPLLSSLLDYRNLMPLYPLLMKIISFKIKKRKPDSILISSFAIAKNITPILWVPTSLYLHSPMQYIWSHYQEYLNKFSGLKKRIFKITASYLRKRDLKYTHFDKIICNSQYTQQLAKEIYHIKSSVIYPKIRDEYYFTGISPTPKPYFVCVWRLVNFVRECELIIQTFNALKLPLLMIGDGPDAQYLKSIAWKTIIFTGWLDHRDLIDTVKNSSWLINLTKESFGIGTAESLLMGVPVLWYAEGATAELLDENSWILISEKSIPELSSALQTFQSKKRDRKLISDTFRTKLSFFSKPLDL